MSITWEEALGLTPPDSVSICKMSQNVTNTPKKASADSRRSQVIDLLKKRKHPSKIAEQFNVTVRTIYRDVDEWMKSNLGSYLMVEWLQLSAEMKESDSAEVFQAITKLLLKYVEKQTKVEVNINQTSQIDISSQVNELIRIGRETPSPPQQPNCSGVP